MRPTPLRRAQPRDREGVAATVAAAFAEDPGWAFILGEEYGCLAADFAGALFDPRVAGETVWVSRSEMIATSVSTDVSSPPAMTA